MVIVSSKPNRKLGFTQFLVKFTVDYFLIIDFFFFTFFFYATQKPIFLFKAAYRKNGCLRWQNVKLSIIFLLGTVTWDKTNGKFILQNLFL